MPLLLLGPSPSSLLLGPSPSYYFLGPSPSFFTWALPLLQFLVDRATPIEWFSLGFGPFLGFTPPAFGRLLDAIDELRSLIRADIHPPPRPNTTPAPGFFPHSTYPSRLGGTLVPVARLWAYALSSYPDRSFPRLLDSVIRNGAELGVGAVEGRIDKKEYRAAEAEMSFLDEEVRRRLDAGEVMEVEADFPTAICPIAAVPKERTKFRAIHDLRPVNDFVPKAFGYLSYSSLSDMYPSLSRSPGAWLWKIDLSNAFRHIRLSPNARRLAGFRHRGKVYVDLCLPFGSRVAPFIFNLLAEALHWVLLKCGIPNLIHYLDDFFGFAESYDEALRIMNLFFAIARLLGVTVNPKKCVGPLQCLTVLGIEVDAVLLEARLAIDRRTRLADDISALVQRKTASRLELEQLAGTLNFACSVIPLGRAFLRHIWSDISGAPRSSDRRRIHPNALADLAWWCRLLADWNGIRLLRPPPRRQLHVWTDASGALGAGGHVGPPGAVSKAFVYKFRAHHQNKIILFKELHAVLRSVRLYAAEWRGAHVTFHVDNQAACSAIDSGSINSDSAQALVRELWLAAAVNNITFSSSWLASAANALADSLSRFDWRPAFLFNGLAASTRAGYNSSIRSYVAFCKTSNSPPFPASSVLLANWIADVASRGTSRPGSIRHGLAAVRSYHTDLGLSDTGFDSPQLDRVFRGIRRHFGQATRRQRLPITLPILTKVLRSIPLLPLSPHDRALLSASFALAYVGGMRCGEITYDSGKFDPLFNMSISDFRDLGSYAVVRLPSSKTDPFRKGVDIIVPSVPRGSPVDPLNLLRALVRQSPPDGPLFSRLDIRNAISSQPQTPSFPRSFFIACLRRCITLSGLDASKYAGHSFRRGLATWAKLATPLGEGDIKLLGRWSSDAVRLYQDTSPTDLAALARSTLVPNANVASTIVPETQCWWGDE